VFLFDREAAGVAGVYDSGEAGSVLWEYRHFWTGEADPNQRLKGKSLQRQAQHGQRLGPVRERRVENVGAHYHPP
jgi:hypothetical protein